MTLESKLKEAIEEWLNSSELNNDTVADLASELGERLRVDKGEAEDIINRYIPLGNKKYRNNCAKALSTAPIITIGEKK